MILQMLMKMIEVINKMEMIPFSDFLFSIEYTTLRGLRFLSTRLNWYQFMLIIQSKKFCVNSNARNKASAIHMGFTFLTLYWLFKNQF